MSWIRSSKGTALVALLALGLALSAVGAVGAVSVAEESAPDEAEVSQRVDATVVLEDPFVNTSDTWTLTGSSGLTNETAEWTVTVTDQGDQVSEDVYEGQAFMHELNASNGGDQVTVELVGEVPSPGTFSYDPRQTFSLYDLDGIVGNSRQNLAAQETHYYTSDSRSARERIDQAAQTIEDTGAGSEAQDLLNNSISAFEAGNFGNAQDLADQAENAAEESEQSQQTQQTLIFAGLAVVAVLIVGGGFYYYRSQQDDYGKLK